jgi:hypothetical protein
LPAVSEQQLGGTLGAAGQRVTKMLHREKTQLDDSSAITCAAFNPCVISKKARAAAFLEFGILAACSTWDFQGVLERLTSL